MPETLYRKYRPQNFDEIVGQEVVVTTLKNEIISSNIAHSYIFAGSRGLGKTSTARIFAKAVNCLSRKDSEYNPCNICEVCESINKGQNVDVIEIDAASNRGINEIRQLRETIGFTPARNRYRVFIIDEVHMLTTEAFNALLKTLEEPPRHVIFILATTELHKVPDTILSRCQIFAFRKVSSDKIKNRLLHICKKEKVKVADDVIDEIAQMSGGFLRDAESILGQVLSIGKAKITPEDASFVLPSVSGDEARDLIFAMQKKDLKKVVKIVEDLDERGVDFTYFVKDVLKVLKNVLEKIYLQEEIIDDLVKIFKENKNLLIYIKFFDRVLFELKRTEFPGLFLEVEILDFLGDSSSVSVVSPSTINSSQQNKKDKEKPSKEMKNRGKNKKADSREIESTEKSKKETEEEMENRIEMTDDDKDFLEKIKTKWADVISVSRKYNHSLPLSLKVSSPISYGVKGKNVLEIGCFYEFHLKKLQKVEVRSMVEDVLKDVLGEDVEIIVSKIEYMDNYEVSQSMFTPEDKEKDDLVDEALDVFGGQLVEG